LSVGEKSRMERRLDGYEHSASFGKGEFQETLADQAKLREIVNLLDKGGRRGKRDLLVNWKYTEGEGGCLE